MVRRRHSLGARTLVGVLIAGALVAGTVAITRWSSAKSHGGASDTRTSNSAESSSSAATAHTGTAGRDSLPTPAPDARLPLPAAVLSGRVVGPDGRGIADAELTWTPLADEFCGPDANPVEIDVEELMRQSRTTKSDADGMFAFYEPAHGAENVASVVWIAHADHIATPVIFAAGAAHWAWPSDLAIELGRGPLLSCRDLESQPIDGATVLQNLVGTPLADGSFDLQNKALRVFFHAYTTGGDGTVRALPARGEAYWRASLGPLSSIRTRGDASQDVAFVLYPTFRLIGRVIADMNGHGYGDANVSLAYFNEPGFADFEWIHRLRVDAQGRFGQTDAPILPRSRLYVLLRGGPFLNSDVTLSTPAAGEALKLDIEALVGETLRVEVFDDKDTPLQGVEVYLDLNVGPEERRQGSSGASDERGGVRLTAPMGTSFRINAIKTGYASQFIGPLVLPIQNDVLVVRMVKAGEIRGQVLHDGAPVPEFTVTGWSEDLMKPWQQDYRDPEGRFSVPGIAPGAVHLLAASASLPQSDVEQIEVIAGGTVDVTLELPDARRGHGLVVEGRMGSPLSTARVQTYTSVNGQVLTARSAAIPVGAGGEFELEGLSADWSAFGVEAEGYASWWSSVPPSTADNVDLGVIVLHPLAHATVRVVGNERPDFSGYVVYSSGGDIIPPTPFDASGTAQLVGLRPSNYALMLRLPSGEILTQAIEIPAGSSMQISFDVSGQCALELEFDPKEPRVHLDGCAVTVYSTAAGGRDIQRRLSITGEHPLVIPRLSPGHVTLELSNPLGELIATDSFELAGVPSQRHTIHLNQRVWRVRVLDSAGDPLPGTRVEACSNDAKSGWRCRRETDGEGICSFGPLAATTMIVSLTNFKIGRRYGIEIARAEGSDAVTDVVLTAGAHAKLLLREQGTPRSGIVIALTHPAASMYEWGYWTSKLDGTISVDDVGEGDYLAVVNHAGYWPTRTNIHCSRAGSDVTIDLVGRGDLTCHARSRYGSAVANARLELRSERLGQTASEWIAEGWIAAPIGGMRTQSDGSITIQGLPRDTYAWRLEIDTGQSVEGSCTVTARTTTALEIVVP